MLAELIVAIDVDTFKKAQELADGLFPRVRYFKVGFQLFTSCGPEIVAYLKKKGARVFLDLKFHDIPNTVASAVRVAVRLGIDMCTLHILGGRDMMEAAKKAAADEAKQRGVKRPALIGVTVLTSQPATKTRVLELARRGIEAGLDGVVSSVREAAYLRKNIKKRFMIVTPGIRPEGLAADDQQRTATAREAVLAGSDFLVVGRPVVAAKNPRLAAEALLREIDGGKQGEGR